MALDDLDFILIERQKPFSKFFISINPNPSDNFDLPFVLISKCFDKNPFTVPFAER